MVVRVFYFVAIVLAVAASRFIPHPPNFTPFLAVAMFAGAKFPSRWMAYLAPVAALWLSDLLKGTHYLMLVVALALMAATMIGQLSESAFENHRPAGKIVGWGFSGLLASIVFFLITNFAVWWGSGIYPHTTDGLWNCYVMALPFFNNQVLSTWIFSAALFGVSAAVKPFTEETLKRHRRL